MSWTTLLQDCFICPSFETVQQEGSFEEVLCRLAASEPEVYWYPGSGSDLAPLIFDAPNNPTGRRLYPLDGQTQGRPLVLWMNDYLGSFWAAPRGFGANQDVQSLERYYHVQLTVPEPVGRFMIQTNGVHKGRRVAIPLSVFKVCVKGGTRGRERPAEGDLYTILFALAETETLLRQVFVPHKIPVRVVALIRQGAFSCQRAHFGLGDFEQYRDVPYLLGEHEPELGQVAAYLKDDDRQIPGYQPTEHTVPHWGANGTRMWVPLGGAQHDA
jgi:hypothetical protein